MLNKQSRAAALTIALDPEVPSATRCSLLADFKRVPPSSEELRALLVPQRVIDEKNQRVRSEILTTILGTPDPELQKQIVNGLKELLLQPPVAADLKSALSATRGVSTTVAVERLKFPADNPSILASDINRGLLVKTRAHELHTSTLQSRAIRELKESV
jgi:hypothetical protein